jgi:transposase
MWHRKGRQPRVCTPGKNRKQYVFGAIDYKSGKFFYHMQDTNNQWGCLVIVQQLVAWARSMRIPVLLVWDNSRTHTAKRLQAYLDQPEVKRWLKIVWLSTYSPDLNDIERLWRHLKRTGVANYLFHSFEDFRTHLLKVLASVNKDSHKITGIIFRVSKAA